MQIFVSYEYKSHIRGNRVAGDTVIELDAWPRDEQDVFRLKRRVVERCKITDAVCVALINIVRLGEDMDPV